jgi:cyanophycinase
MLTKLFRLLVLMVVAATLGFAQQSAKYQYFRVGNQQDVTTKTQFGVALMGGGTDLDEAFQWMCTKSGGGDFLVIRATGNDDYNPYIQKLCHQNSVATLIIPDREAAMDPAVAAIISKAEALFISGGDQSNYVKYWKGTPVQTAINGLVQNRVPIGGTSAGLAVLGQFSFSAMHDTAYSKETLANPFNDGVTIATDFLNVPHLGDTITDTHFVKRDRQGRFLGFMARIMADGMAKRIRGVAFDERSAGLMEADGKVKVVGTGKGGYFYRPKHAPECAAGKPLTFRDIEVYRAGTGASFDLAHWKGKKGESSVLNVIDGKITTTQPGGAEY